ncbi:MAG: hypothetical protein HOJ67_05875 [Rhodospirillaceae bacterium]|jgi:predicted DNA-binding transcriptional regulator AlpA|nr:hypothetical protein [Rhodospirillaceae bacterium]
MSEFDFPKTVSAIDTVLKGRIPNNKIGGLSKNLLDDGYIAHDTSMSKSWVRQERHKRRHGLPHILTIDPVMIGSSPRYRRSDYLEWIESLVAANDNKPTSNEKGNA